MLDLLIIQLFVMGAVFWRAAHEKLAWDRAGFVMLGCSCALMALRRASAPMDDFLKSGQVILPLAISWILAASASCFAIEMFVRLKNKPEAHRHPDYAGPKRYFWPFLWFFLIAGLDFIAGRAACERISDAAIAAIERMHLDMYAHYLRHEVADYFRLNQMIHQAIVDAAANPFLSSSYASANAIGAPRARSSERSFGGRVPSRHTTPPAAST